MSSHNSGASAIEYVNIKRKSDEYHQVSTRKALLMKLTTLTTAVKNLGDLLYRAICDCGAFKMIVSAYHQVPSQWEIP